MAYRKTEKVLAQLEAKRNSIVAATMDVIARDGLDGLTSDAIAERAGVAVGLIYHYFADLPEVMAAVIQRMMERDRDALRTIEESNPIDALVAGIRLWNERVLENYRLMEVIARRPQYREAIRAEFAKLVKATGLSDSPAVAAASLYGAILEVGATWRPSQERELLAGLLRLVGVAPAKAREKVN